MPRLLYATRKNFYPESAGGAQRSTLEILERLQERGWAVAVASLTSIFGPTFRRGQREAVAAGRRPGPTIYDEKLGFPTWRRIQIGRIPGSARFDLMLGNRVMDRIVSEFQPDVVLGDSLARCPMLLRPLVHGVPAVYLARSVPVIGTPSILPPGLHFLGNSPYSAAALEAITGESVEIVRPVVTATKYRSAERDPRYVTFVNPIPHKGLGVALEVARRMPETRFLFVKGRWSVYEGRQLERLVAPAHELPNVDVWEYQEDMRRVYAATRTLLVPSQFIETFGRVILEAQTNGIPVVGARVGGIPYTMGEGGIVVEPKHDAGAYVAALQRLERDPALHHELSERARTNSEREDFDPDAQIDMLVRFLEKRVIGSLSGPSRDL
jgi:glycosyltransferase involved in cell wall biosynthesis